MSIAYANGVPLIILGNGDTAFSHHRTGDVHFLHMQSIPQGEVGRNTEGIERSDSYAMIAFTNVESLDVTLRCLNWIREQMVYTNETTLIDSTDDLDTRSAIRLDTGNMDIQ